MNHLNNFPFSNIIDHHNKTRPKWIEEEDTSSEVAPPCRHCHKSTNNGNFYSDIHSSPSSQRMQSRQTGHPQPMEEGDSVRGEVGIIDLSHAEINRRDNAARLHSQNLESPRQKNYHSSALQEKSSNIAVERDKGRAQDVIEIDPSSPTASAFLISPR